MPLLRRGAALLALVFVFAGVPAGAQSAARPDDAVFQLLTMTQENQTYHSVWLGTAFFIDADGTALTNSHVVYLVRQDPARYQLLAVVGREFYSAVVVCASTLEVQPGKGTVPLGRDIAAIKLGPSRFPFASLSYESAGLEYTAHLTPLPPFPVLTLGADPAPGAAVRVVGYGIVQERLTPGTRWTADGTVDDVGAAPDGTPVFRIASTDRPREGNSGSPVLDDAGRVVGMWTWNEEDNLAYGVAIASSALARPCGAGGAIPRPPLITATPR